MKTVGVVTALNEQDTIGELVTGLLAVCDRVIVINDGSTDNTGIIASAKGAHEITHYKPHGIAASLMEAWRLALDEDADRIVQIDAGGSHDPARAADMLRSKAEVVIGSRFLPASKYIGGKRKNFSRAYASLCNFAIGGYVVSDWTSGYRVFSRHALEVLLSDPPYWTKMHAWQAEVIHRAVRRCLSVCEVPITYRAGRSSMRLHHFDDAILVWLKVMVI